MQARVPPGRHIIELSYWPTAFTVGIALAICSALGLCVAIIAALIIFEGRDQRFGSVDSFRRRPPLPGIYKRPTIVQSSHREVGRAARGAALGPLTVRFEILTVCGGRTVGNVRQRRLACSPG